MGFVATGPRLKIETMGHPPMRNLAAEVRETRKTLRQVREQVASGQVTMVRSKFVACQMRFVAIGPRFKIETMGHPGLLG
jgi:hypothetical protein